MQLQHLRLHIVGQIKAQPVRAVIMAVLLSIMGGLWLKHFVAGGSSPTAAASVVAPAPVAAASAAPAPQALSRAAASLKDFLARPPAPVVRNLFQVRLEHFPSDATVPAPSPDNGGPLSALARMLLAKADQEKARRILVENLKEQASKLNLQSTMTSGGTPRALIDGQLVGVGDVVAGFKIVRIEASRIVVQREGIKLEVPFSFHR